MTWTIHHHDVSVTPWPLEDESVQCVVTSPPYWGLRDYGTAKWEGGSDECDHNAAIEARAVAMVGTSGFSATNNAGRAAARAIHGKNGCPSCGARRIDSQIGLERTPDEYVAKLVAVFREIRRVLRKDGTVWLNLGDCYAHSIPGGGSVFDKGRTDGRISYESDKPRGREKVATLGPGLKPKDLVGIPWRVAFALQADGWWLRSDIVWAKPNPMPESIRDRPTRAHEYVFLLSRSSRYFYDQDAIRQPLADCSVERLSRSPDAPIEYRHDMARIRSQPSANRVYTDRDAMDRLLAQGANARTVWQIATEPFPEAHFATFPTELARRCVLAGTSEAGACWECGSPWVRETERTPGHSFDCPKTEMAAASRGGRGSTSTVGQSGGSRVENKVITLGFRPSCSCNAEARKPCVVLDPFSGAGTVALVADILGRDAVGLELNPEYVEMSRRRVAAPRTEAEAERRGREEAGQMSLMEG